MVNNGIRLAGRVARKGAKRITCLFWAESMNEKDRSEDVVFGWRKRSPEMESSCEYTE